ALLGLDALEVRACEHPLVVELAKYRVRFGTGSHDVVGDHPLEKAHSGRRLFVGRGLGENALIDDAQEGVAGFERLEKNRPATRLERAFACRKHARWIENVV